MSSYITKTDRYDRELFDPLTAVLEYYARKGKTVEYGKLMDAFGLSHTMSQQRVEFGYLLGMISRVSQVKHQAMLSVIVVTKQTGKPSTGFYELADEMGRRQPGETDDAMAARLTDEVFAAYRSAA